ncbi:ATP-binding cassette sub-family G member 8-like [Amphibalanus amphitrite]|uniref:ATP-binding cassette sub-family G member 8-like n=1 Tax=Amphibalanus amphitrite TaxID=1232801 RepID=UPI001C91A7C9|nr:ATP-binding cassette sub-family G member 8-like [Amphibalanus amphitrite]
MFGGLRTRSRSDGPDAWELNAMGRQYPASRQWQALYSSQRNLGGPQRHLGGSQRYLGYSRRNRGDSHRYLDGSHRNIGGSHRNLNVSDESHPWSMYRQNLNSEFADSALGSSDKSPIPPGGNFQLRESALLRGTPLGPRSQVGADMYKYLKNGLPRVFPPPRPDGSSGYDSSGDDSPAARRRRRQRRTLSQPDLRLQGGRGLRRFGDSMLPSRARASSEADLLSAESNASPESDEDLASHGELVARLERRRPAGGRPAGFAGRAAPDREPPMLNTRLFPPDQQLEGNRPQLQVRQLGCERRVARPGGWRRMLDDVTFEARGGELVGIMATSEAEGTALLDVLGDCSSRGQLRISGQLALNGTTVLPARLAERLTYVQRDGTFSGHMSVRQTLLFHAFLQEPGHVARCFNTKNKINALIEDLGLGQVKHTSVCDLTESELCRLNVACHLCLETDLVLLDQPTRHMDIFDTFFMIEYLRQWAARGRIVMLTLQPPTYEIFNMLGRVLLLADRRLVFSGKAKQMLPYFTFIDYECPSYKNPSDYYLDLVTLDELSPEAHLESSQRVSELSEAFQRRQETLEMPGPAGLLPPRVRRAGCCAQLMALAVQATVYKFPYNVMGWAVRLMAACIMSLIVGTVFYDIRGEDRDQETVPDRTGFHYAMLSLAAWPSLLLTVSDIWREKDVVSRDIDDRLYSRACHTVSQIFFGLPGSALECIMLVAPAHRMAGSQPSDTASTFYVYAGYMLLYLQCVRLLAIVAAYLSSSRHLSAGWLAAALLPLLLVAGWSVHPHELSAWTGWLAWASAPAWLYQRLVWNELAHIRRLRCQRNPALPQDNTIIVQLDCGLTSGQEALSFLAVPDERTPLVPLMVAAVTTLLAVLLALLTALLVRQRRSGSRARRARIP